MTKMFKNNKGMSLLELMATIVVGSVVTMILMQVLVMTVNARTQLDIDNKMVNESYYIAEQIRFSIFQLEPQELELIEDSSTQTVIHIRHLYDFTTNAQNEIVPDYSNPVTDILLLEKTTDGSSWNIFYNGVQLNDSSVFLDTTTSMTLTSIDPATCNLATNACDQGILTLTLTIAVTLNNGTVLEPQTYVTTILV